MKITGSGSKEKKETALRGVAAAKGGEQESRKDRAGRRSGSPSIPARGTEREGLRNVEGEW